MNLKNFKIVQRLKNLAPRLKWLMFSKVQDLKIGARYIDYIISDDRKTPNYDNTKLEEMVKATLVQEFSPDIVKSASYDLLVDAVVHNLKKKQLGKEEVEIKQD